MSHNNINIAADARTHSIRTMEQKQVAHERYEFCTRCFYYFVICIDSVSCAHERDDKSVIDYRCTDDENIEKRRMKTNQYQNEVDWKKSNSFKSSWANSRHRCWWKSHENRWTNFNMRDVNKWMKMHKLFDSVCFFLFFFCLNWIRNSCQITKIKLKSIDWERWRERKCRFNQILNKIKWRSTSKGQGEKERKQYITRAQSHSLTNWTNDGDDD